ncbi:hypothetical protein [Gulosibacter sediminis]|uniref:hypothetical protein n=1 Tax=Gulosibacter sediminis TaxID=1729695 RepID=UPI0024A89D82|nr:hypothetical protein [Gulosibacter sediminis]
MNLSKTRFTASLIIGGLATTGMLVAPSFLPISSATASSNDWPDFQSTTFGYQPLSAPTTSTHASELADKSSDNDIIGYRYENDDIVGEFFTSTTQTVDDFTSNFYEQFGTYPEVVSLIYIKPIDSTSASKNTDAPTIVTGQDEYVADPIEDSVADEMLLSDTSASDSTAAPNSASTPWTPQEVSASTWREGNNQRFSIRMAWGNSHSPTKLDGNYGIEFEINLYNSPTLSGKRPACPSGYKNNFLAKREGWSNWFVSTPTGNGISNAQPYADYNDLGDSCNTNSMAVGVRYGNRIPPTQSGAYSVSTGIVAPKGTQSSNIVGGVIQSVNNLACISGMALTDCMGVAGGTQGNQPFLNYVRGVESATWRARPNLCWHSLNYGDSAPVKEPC